MKFSKLKAKCFKDGVDAAMSEEFCNNPYKDGTKRNEYWWDGNCHVNYGWDYCSGEIDLCVDYWWRIPEVTQQEYDESIALRNLAGMMGLEYDEVFPKLCHVVESVDRSKPRREYDNNYFVD